MVYKLFTPGPANTSNAVRSAMNRDLGSRTKDVIALTQSICKSIEKISGCGPDFSCIPLQGSGTYALEAMITSLLPENAHVLIPVNGQYAERMVKICNIYGIRYQALILDPMRAIDVDEVETELNTNVQYTHILAVHFETGLGVLNNINDISILAVKYRCELLVDAISTIGALNISYKRNSLSAVAGSSNKCLHGVPGIAFVIVKKCCLSNKNKQRTLTLDLCAQWRRFNKDGEWRFTPPPHVLLALEVALYAYISKGGSSRIKQYSRYAEKIIHEFVGLGFCPVIEESYRAPIAITFKLGAQHHFHIDELFHALYEKGIVIYGSNLASCFRVSVIGELSTKDIESLTLTVKEFCQIQEEKFSQSILSNVPMINHRSRKFKDKLNQ